MTNVEQTNGRKITKRDNQRGTDLGAFVASLARDTVRRDTGCIEAVVKCEAALITVAASYQAELAKGEDGSIRECLLNAFLATAEGAKFSKLKASIPAKAGERSEAQQAAFDANKKFENAINMQMIRTVDTFIGVETLRKQKRTVNIMPVGKTGVYACFVKSHSEVLNTPFNAKQLQTVRKVANKVTEQASTELLMKAIKSYNKKTGAANKQKGGEPELLSQSEAASEAERIVTACSRYEDSFTSGQRTKLAALWASLNDMLTQEQKDAALKVFNTEGDAPKVAKVKGKKAA